MGIQGNDPRRGEADAGRLHSALIARLLVSRAYVNLKMLHASYPPSVQLHDPFLMLGDKQWTGWRGRCK
jgi:hypothetical protein